MNQRIESLLCDVIVMISRKSRLQTLPCRFVSFHNTSILGFLVWVSVSTRYSFPKLLKTLSGHHLARNNLFQKSVEFLSCVFESFFVLFVFRIHEAWSSQFSCSVNLLVSSIAYSCFSCRPQEIWSGSCEDLHSRQIHTASQQFCCVVCDWEYDFFTLSRRYDFLCLGPSSGDFWRVHRVQLLNVSNQNSSLPDSPRNQCVSEESSWQDFLTKLVEPWLVFRRDRKIFKPLLRTDCSVHQMVLRTASHKVFAHLPRGLEHFVHKAIALHRSSPPFFIQAGLQQYCRRSFLASAHCSFGNPTRLRLMRCGSAMINDRSSQDLPNFNELSV